MFQILIADDEPNIREGVRQFITRRCPEWQVVGAARDGRDIRISAKEVEKLLPRLFFLPKNSKEGGRHHEV